MPPLPLMLGSRKLKVRTFVRQELFLPNMELNTSPDADRRSTLIFGLSVAHVVTLTNTFRARGIDARFVYEGTKQADRVELYRAFRAGDFPVLVNYGILTEGGTSS